MLSFHNLSIGYGRHAVCRHLTARLASGKLVALLGTNGCGKSTLLRTLAGFLPPVVEAESKGEASLLLEGKPLDSYQARELARRISVVLTFRPEAEALTVADVVEMGRIPYAGLWYGTTETDRRQVARAMQLAGVEAFAHRPLNALSDGERQRVFIAKALAQATPLILLDEPTAFLDFPSKIQMLRLLRRLAHEEGKTILLSTHDVEQALHLADELWLLSPGGLQYGSPAELSADGSLGRYFSREGLTFDPEHLRFRYEAQVVLPQQ